MHKSRGTALALLLFVSPFPVACQRDGGRGDRSNEGASRAEAQVDERLGTLKVMNQTAEPVAIYLDGREIYSVPPGRAYVFRNLRVGETNLYGVGRVSQRYYGLPVITVEAGEEYEWMIRP